MMTKPDEQHGGAEESVSALMDGELKGSAAHRTISNLQYDAALSQLWGRYHLIREALRKELPEQFMGSIAARVSHALASEPTVLAPRKITLEAKFRALSPALKQLSGLAIAASVTAVAVLSVQTGVRQPSINPAPSIALAPHINSNEFTPVIASTNPPAETKNIMIAIPSPPSVTTELAQTATSGKVTRSALEARLNYYLGNHNEHVLPSEMQGMLPYARIVVHNPVP
jgi:negative regulator of sigma E activity